MELLCMKEFIITARDLCGHLKSGEARVKQQNASGNKCPRRNSPLKENIAAENKCCRLVGSNLAEAISYNE